jgi:hypothetical protein
MRGWSGLGSGRGNELSYNYLIRCQEAEMAAVRIGDVGDFLVQQLEPVAGEMVTCGALFDDYRAWCATTEAVPLARGEFTLLLEDITAEAELPVRQRGGNWMILDATLKAS